MIPLENWDNLSLAVRVQECDHIWCASCGHTLVAGCIALASGTLHNYIWRCRDCVRDKWKGTSLWLDDNYPCDPTALCFAQHLTSRIR